MPVTTNGQDDRLMPDGILFDLDGTLIDSERESAEAMARALANNGLEINQDDRDFIIGRSWVEIFRELKDKYPNLPCSIEQLIEQTAIQREAILANDGFTIMPGALDLLARLATAQVPMAVVTGSSRREATSAIAALGHGQWFRALYAAEDVPTSKPDPAGYLAGAKALGANVTRCLVIEDSFAGIRAGRAAGAVVLAVRAGNFANQDQSDAHRIIDNLAQLDDGLLAELCGMFSEPQ